MKNIIMKNLKKTPFVYSSAPLTIPVFFRINDCKLHIFLVKNIAYVFINNASKSLQRQRMVLCNKAIVEF